MASFTNFLEQHTEALSQLERVYAQAERSYNDVVEYINATPSYLQGLIRQSDEFRELDTNWTNATETFNTIKSSVVNIDDTSDWDAVQELMNVHRNNMTEFDRALEAYNTVIGANSNG